MPKNATTRTVVIDMGSNSFRLVVYDSMGERWWRHSDEIYDGVRIGAGLGESGRLSEERIALALEVMEVYAHFCAASRIPTSSVLAVATSAIRDAANGHEFAAEVKRRTKLDVRILSEPEEAYYAYLAAVNTTTLSDGVVLDLGGGSLQLVHVGDRQVLARSSWQLGTVRTTERFFARGAGAKQQAALRDHVLGELARSAWLKDAAATVVGMGGTVRNLASAAATVPERAGIGVHGFVLRREALEELIGRLARASETERAQIPGIKPERAGIILAGAVVIAAVLDAVGAPSLEVTEAGLREGVFFSTHLAPRDPPVFEDVRKASVLNLAGQYQPDLTHPQHVAGIARRIWRSLEQAEATPGTNLDADWLLWAGDAPRHRNGDRLRRPPQALALPRARRRPARLQPAGAGPDRADGALSPQGHSRARRARRRLRAGRRAPVAGARCRAEPCRAPRPQP
jgi:exopolyphosphatase/guanosine-5'-triphosphate,3'-diphosphate pyrophosphatase